MIQVFFHPPNGRAVPKQLKDQFTLEDFVKAVSEVLDGASREKTMKYRLVVQGKPLILENADAFYKSKHYITNDCNIFMLLRLESLLSSRCTSHDCSAAVG
jgi:hypothetical protein